MTLLWLLPALLLLLRPRRRRPEASLTKVRGRLVVRAAPRKRG